jgi:hypothetical protein
MTGARLKETSPENPVREAYYKFFGNAFKNQPSWDQITVLYGVRGACNYFKQTSEGEGSHPSGYKWEMKKRKDTVLEALLPAEAYARIIEDLMLEPPVKQTTFEK